LAEKTDITLRETKRIKPRVHLPVYHTKAAPGGPTLGSAEPGWHPGTLSFGGKLPHAILKAVPDVPYKVPSGTDLSKL
jgi:hypothetical protein